jgi:hypothetical protein
MNDEPTGTAGPANDTPEQREIKRLRRECARWRLKLREAERKISTLEGSIAAFRELADSVVRKSKT